MENVIPKKDSPENNKKEVVVTTEDEKILQITQHQTKKRDEYIPEGKPVENALGDNFMHGTGTN